MQIGSTTRTVGVIGWPVSGSLSPRIHNAAFEALGLDWVYVALPVPSGALAEALEGLPALGFSGANVTMPHKTGSADLVGDLSEDAERLRSVNTILCVPSGLEGHNTDAPGFGRFLRTDAGFDPAGRTALLYGAGGAARACALSLARDGLGELAVAVRSPARADGVRTALEGLATRVTVVQLDVALDRPVDLLVNATPLGAVGEALPLPPLGPGTIVVDLLYRPSTTPLLEAARAAGARSFGGLGLLLHQAALSFELWTGQAPSLDVMSAAALAALAEPGSATQTPPR